MCFSENQSFLNTFLLLAGSIYVYPKHKLTLFLIFLAIKDLIQGLLYRFQNNEKFKNLLGIMSWVHICFQPFFVNLFMSSFSNYNNQYWNIILIICFLYGIFTLTTLDDLDIENDSNCVTKNKKNDFCSNKTTSYIGKYHVAYQFKRDNDILFFPILYLILMFLPSLLVDTKMLGLFWMFFVILIYIFFKDIGEGEKAAIWCYSSILFFLPISIFNQIISKNFIF